MNKFSEAINVFCKIKRGLMAAIAVATRAISWLKSTLDIPETRIIMVQLKNTFAILAISNLLKGNRKNRLKNREYPGG
jgi:hypothetical protein